MVRERADISCSKTSKTLNYINSPLVVPYFSVFIVIWTYLRHYINLVILYATLTEFRSVGAFDLNWETQQYKCWISQYITFALLAILQSINMLWLFFIGRIAYNIAFAKLIQDVRSDDEESGEEKEGESRKAGVAGREAKEKRANGRLTNGKAPEPNAESVAERKKEM